MCILKHLSKLHRKMWGCQLIIQFTIRVFWNIQYSSTVLPASEISRNSLACDLPSIVSAVSVAAGNIICTRIEWRYVHVAVLWATLSNSDNCCDVTVIIFAKSYFCLLKLFSFLWKNSDFFPSTFSTHCFQMPL